MSVQRLTDLEERLREKGRSANLGVEGSGRCKGYYRPDGVALVQEGLAQKLKGLEVREDGNRRLESRNAALYISGLQKGSPSSVCVVSWIVVEAHISPMSGERRR